MASSSPSALITDHGARVLLRLGGRYYELTQPALRQVLALPEGPPGLGITIDRDRLHFEFVGDARSVTISAAQLQRRLAKRTAANV
ncbi:MAG: hypothetical protein L0Z62_37920 [Gemmataceae bacterium]|nr:hypothetical protein [Gemmataceae bacterium]